jgi:glutamine synthetase
MNIDSIKELEKEIRERSIETVIVAFCDMQGRLVGKRVTSKFFLDKVAGDGIEVCDYLLAVDLDMTPLDGYSFANWQTGYGDMKAVVDPQTFRIIPWHENTALVLCDLYNENEEPVNISPRQILKDQLNKAALLGFEVKCATELEFFLYKETYESARLKNWKFLNTTSDSIQDYQIYQTSKDEKLLGEIRKQMQAASIPVEFSKGEAGIGQHEINITYRDPLTCADNHMIFKNGVKELAYLNDLSASFMAKPAINQVGSSCHIHSSLWDKNGNSLMADSGRELSINGRKWLAGIMDATKDLIYFWAPYVNSYKRFQKGSWAPTAIAWSYDNRTVGYRVVGRDESLRVESRIPGADVNPYLALAAIIAAGINGIESEISLPDKFKGNGYENESLERVPTTLIEAIEHLKSSKTAIKLLGKSVYEHYLNTAIKEWEAFNNCVTDWEVSRYFERG